METYIFCQWYLSLISLFSTNLITAVFFLFHSYIIHNLTKWLVWSGWKWIFRGVLWPTNPGRILQQWPAITQGNGDAIWFLSLRIIKEFYKQLDKSPWVMFNWRKCCVWQKLSMAISNVVNKNFPLAMGFAGDHFVKCDAGNCMRRNSIRWMCDCCGRFCPMWTICTLFH